MGHLRPIEEGVLLPFMHNFNNIGSILPTSGIGVQPHIGKGEADAEVYEIEHQFQTHRSQQKSGAGAAAQNPVIPACGKGGGSGFLRYGLSPGGIEQEEEIYPQENQIVGNKAAMGGKGADVQKNILQGIRRQEADLAGKKLCKVGEGFAAEKDVQAQDSANDNLPGLELAPQQPGPVSHHQQHKAEEETEAVGNHIGEVEAVPDVVQLAENKAQAEKQQKPQAAQLVPEVNLGTGEKHHGKQCGNHAAVQVGQTLLEGGGDAAVHVSRHLAHGIQKPQPGVFVGDVQLEPLGELVHGRLGGLQGRQGRQFQNGGHGNGNDRKKRHPQKVGEEPLEALPAADFIAHKGQKHENAGEKAHIIVGEHRQKQSQSVKEEFAIAKQADFSQNHQRQQGEGVQPHEIPLIPQSPGTQGVEGTEDADGKIILVENLFQEDGKEHSCQAQAKGQKQGEQGQKPAFRHQNGKKIQRRGQIVGDEAQIVHAHTHIPAVKQTVPG